MAIAILDTDLLTESGNITIPDNCTMIHAAVFGSENAPSINGATMAKIHSVPANTKVAAISIFEYYVTEDNVTVPFVISGTHVTLWYTSGAGPYRPNVLLGNATSGTLTGDLPAATSDLAIAILAGMIGATSIKGDTVAFTYDRNDTFLKTGHFTPGDTVLSCELKDVGVSAGYTIDGGGVTHPSVLISDEYYSYELRRHWNSFSTVSSGYNSNTKSYWLTYSYYIDGVYQYTTTAYGSTAPSLPSNYYSNYYVQVYHPAVWSEPWFEEYPDIVVPGGEQAQINGMVVLIQTGAALEFVPKVVIGQ